MLRELNKNEINMVAGGTTGTRLPNSSFYTNYSYGSVSQLAARGLNTSSPASPSRTLEYNIDDRGYEREDEDNQ